MSDKTIQDLYLRRILNSKVYDVAIESPLEKAATLSKKLGKTFLLKREDLQSVHSFKLRGAYNKMSQLPRDALEKGVLAASAGNHAQGVALSAKRLGCKATIVMPVTTPEIRGGTSRQGETLHVHPALRRPRRDRRTRHRRDGDPPSAPQ